MRRSLIILSATLLVGGLISWTVAGLLVAPQPVSVGDLPGDLAGEDILLSSQSGALISGWVIPAENTRAVIVLLHGIRSNRLSMLARARFLVGKNFSVVMIDLSAHGESSGDQITVGYQERFDVQVAVEYSRQRFPTKKVGVIGVSLGGAAALIGSPLGIDALVLEAVFADIEHALGNRVAGHLGWFGGFPTQILMLQLKPRLGFSPAQLRPIDHIAAANCPVYVIAGRDDRYTPVAETRQLFASAVEPKNLWLIDGAEHVDLHLFSGEEYESNVIRFFEKYL